MSALETSKGLCDLLDCCVIGCGEELVWIVYVLESGGGLLVRWACIQWNLQVCLSFFCTTLVSHAACQIGWTDRWMCSLFVLCLFSVWDGVSQSLEIGSDQFRFSWTSSVSDVCVVCDQGFPTEAKPAISTAMTTTWAPVMRKRPAVPPKPTWKPCLLLGANFRTFPDLILLSSRPTTTPTTDASQTQEHTQLRAMQMLSLIIIPNESATARLVVLLVIPISTACGGPITPCCSKAFSLPGTTSKAVPASTVPSAAPARGWQLVAAYAGHRFTTQGLLLDPTPGSQSMEIMAEDCSWRVKEKKTPWRKAQVELLSAEDGTTSLQVKRLHEKLGETKILRSATGLQTSRSWFRPVSRWHEEHLEPCGPLQAKASPGLQDKHVPEERHRPCGWWTWSGSRRRPQRTLLVQQTGHDANERRPRV